MTLSYPVEICLIRVWCRIEAELKWGLFDQLCKSNLKSSLIRSPISDQLKSSTSGLCLRFSLHNIDYLKMYSTYSQLPSSPSTGKGKQPHHFILNLFSLFCHFLLYFHTFYRNRTMKQKTHSKQEKKVEKYTTSPALNVSLHFIVFRTIQRRDRIILVRGFK